MLRFFFCFSLFLSQTSTAFALEQFDFTGSVASQQFKGEKLKVGAGLYTRYVRLSGRTGWMFEVNWRGHILAPNIVVAYGIRFGDDSYFDLGAGPILIGLQGLSGAVILAYGWNIAGRWGISINLLARIDKYVVPDWGPFISYRF